MNIKVMSFKYAYNQYYEVIDDLSFNIHKILEIGGGAHPSLSSREDTNYTIVDPDKSELDKAPDDVTKIATDVQEFSDNSKYDLILSKMVLEHVENPDSFHKKVYNLLSSGGKAIHFFACRNSLPAFANRFLSEQFGNRILKLLKNRDLVEAPKYEAFYRRTLGGFDKQISYFENMGFQVEIYNSYVGHTYLTNLPLLKQLEQIYTILLSRFKLKYLTTVALVVLSKNQ